MGGPPKGLSVRRYRYISRPVTAEVITLKLMYQTKIPDAELKEAAVKVFQRGLRQGDPAAG
jgi:hypothetical protein